MMSTSRDLARALRWRLGRVGRLLGLVGPRQLYAVGDGHRKDRPPSSVGAGHPSTLIVGPGLLQIPVDEWGAIEVIIDEMASELAATRPVTVLNSGWIWLWLRAFTKRYDVIYVHGAEFLPRVTVWRRLTARSIPIVVWSHGPHIAGPTTPSPGYRVLWRRLTAWTRPERRLDTDDVFVALNPTIAEMMSSTSPLRVLMLPNGSDFDPRVEESPTRDVLVVGRVEARKRQFEYSELSQMGVDITCVGPIVDERVRTLIADDPDSARSRSFVGPWSRATLARRMSDHRVLLLPSFAEADALVLYEGQLAGLSIVCSRAALGSQDPTLPWIYVFDADDSIDAVRRLCQRAIEDNQIHRTAISDHARAEFRWSDRIRRLDEFLRVADDRPAS